MGHERLTQTPEGRLTIQAYSEPSCKAKDRIGDEFVGDFNPSDYTLTRTNKYSQQKTCGTTRPAVSYSGGENDTLQIGKFFFDGTGVKGKAGSVRERVDDFLALMEYRGGVLDQPPYLKLTWGDFEFRGIMKSATAKFTLFDGSGRPIRAEISADFEQVVTDEERIAVQKTSSPTVSRVWPLREADRIDLIAHESYGDARFWSALATANRLPNPRALVPGAILQLPRLES